MNSIFLFVGKEDKIMIISKVPEFKVTFFFLSLKRRKNIIKSVNRCFVFLHFDATQNGGKGRAGFLGGGGGGPPTSSLISVKLVMGRGGFSGGTSPLPVMLFCCLAGKGGGRSSPDDELIVDATLFCDGEEQTPSPLKGLLTVDERLSLTTSERRGRLAVNCCVNSITTVGETVSLELALFTVSDDDDTSNE